VMYRNPPVNSPEDALIGVMYDEEYPVNADIQVRDASHWIFAGTGLKDGGKIRGLIGFEADHMFWSAPKSLVRLASSDFVGVFGRKNYSDMTLYQTPKGSLVFATGTMQWIWGLDDFRPPPLKSPGLANPVAQKITQNLFAEMLAPKHFKPFPSSPTLL